MDCTVIVAGSAAQLGVHVVPIQGPRAPSFLLQPPTRLEFSNSSGGRLDCSASGTPTPVVSWVSGDGSPVVDLGSVRRLLPNGTLLLLPFAAAAYRQDVHAATYRCLASNSVGTITSREVHVRAGKLQPKLREYRSYTYRASLPSRGGASSWREGCEPARIRYAGRSDIVQLGKDICVFIYAK